MFVDIQPSVWFGISLACQYPSDLLTVNTVTSDSEYQTYFYYFRLTVKVIMMQESGLLWYIGITSFYQCPAPTRCDPVTKSPPGAFEP